eukprot:332666-Chlamydomonas_euryale.AAC.3
MRNRCRAGSVGVRGPRKEPGSYACRGSNPYVVRLQSSDTAASRCPSSLKRTAQTCGKRGKPACHKRHVTRDV